MKVFIRKTFVSNTFLYKKNVKYFSSIYPLHNQVSNYVVAPPIVAGTVFFFLWYLVNNLSFLFQIWKNICQ